MGQFNKTLREWIRHNISKKDWFRIFVAIFFTVIHDAAGLFSASRTISRIPLFDDVVHKFLLVYVPIVFFDLTSELVLLGFHDIPLVKKRPISVGLVRAALVGQILTSIMWFSLMIWVAYDAIFRKCAPPQSLAQCKAVSPGLSETLVVLLVWIKNSMTIKAYFDKFGVYPIICDESYLFLHHFLRKDPFAIVTDFKKANGVEETKEEEEESTTTPTVKPERKCLWWTDTNEFVIASNYVVLIGMDIAALASVSNLVTGAPNLLSAGLAAFGFGLIVLLDITSESAILYVHDLPLLKGYTCHHRTTFTISRIIQCLCTLGWIITLGYMVSTSLYYNSNCVTMCNNCSYTNDLTCLNSPQCGSNGTCIFSVCEYIGSGQCSIRNNGTDEYGWWTFPNNHKNATLINTTLCSAVVTREECISFHPTAIDCVLLGMVLLEACLGLVQMWFKSDIYPITIPEATMFTCLLHWSEKSVDVRHKLILEAVGKFEFGKNFSLDETTGGSKEPVEEGETAPLIGGGGNTLVTLEQ